jgi:hypothetical protein
MGEQVPAVDRAQFNVRFSFAECGDFLDERGAQAGSRAVFAHPG